MFQEVIKPISNNKEDTEDQRAEKLKLLHFKHSCFLLQLCLVLEKSIGIQVVN